MMNSSSAIHVSCQSPLPPVAFCHGSRVHVRSLISHVSLITSIPKPTHLVLSSRPHRFSYLERQNKNNNNMMVRGGSVAMACGDYAAAGEEGSVTGPLNKLNSLHFFQHEPDDNEIEALKLYAMAVSKDDPRGALEIVSKERQNWARGEADAKLLLALVELLVYQEDYDEASKKLEELREVVKADKEVPITSDFMHTKWKKFYLLKAIVECVNEAREKIKPKETAEGVEVEVEDEDEDDTDKPKDELWLIYSRKLKFLHLD